MLVNRRQPARSMRGRHWFVAVVSITVLVFASSTALSAPAEVRILALSGPEATYVRQAAEYYNQRVGPSENIRIQVEELGREGYFERVTTSLLSRSPAFDVAWVLNTMVGQFARAGVVENLDPYFKDPKLFPYSFDNYLPVAIEGVRIDGKVYAVPLWISTQFLYYRADLISDPQALDTWEGFLQTARRFTRSHNPSSPTEYGATIQGRRFVTLPKEFYIYMWSFGGDFFTNGRPSLNSLAAVNALTFYVDLLRRHRVVPPDAVNYEYSQVLNALLTGKVAMAIQWDAAYNELKKNLGDKIAIRATPAGPGGRAAFTHWYGAVINAASRQRREAFRVLAWMTSDPQGSVLLGRMGLPVPARSVLLNPEVVAVNPHWAFMYDFIAKSGRSEPSISAWPEVEQTLINALSAALAGEMTPEDALGQANRTLGQAISR